MGPPIDVLRVALRAPWVCRSGQPAVTPLRDRCGLNRVGALQGVLGANDPADYHCSGLLAKLSSKSPIARYRLQPSHLS